MLIEILVTLALILTAASSTCPPHDFKENGIGWLTISVRSSLKWVTQEKSSLIGITLSSSSDRGSRTITQEFYIKSPVLICSKCGKAAGTVFMTLDQLRKLSSLHPVLEPLLSKAIAQLH
jgi:hypothetical protein